MSDHPDPEPRAAKPISKAPPPLPRPTSTSVSARAPETQHRQREIAHATADVQETNGVIERIKRLLPTFRYQANARYGRPNAQLNAVAAAIQDRLPGCQVIADGNGAIVVKNIDRFLDLGVFDKWITMNWFFREVDARISLSNQGQSPLLVAEIEQRPSSNFAIYSLVCIPLLCVGLLGFGFALIFTNLAKETIRSAVQRLLNDVGK
jgi:hypothetical protein